MTNKKLLAYCAAGLMTIAGFFGGCGDTIKGKDCKVTCQDVDNTCIQKCNDDTCKTTCKTDLDNCTASCDSITVSPDGGK